MKMRRVRISQRGYMNVEIYYDAGIEIEIPEDVEYSEMEDYLEENEDLKEQFDITVREEIQGIHDKLTAAFGDDGYDDRGGEGEFDADEITEDE